jgi:hypothetical protein
MHEPLIQPCCKFYYCTSINFYNGRFSFIWKNVRFYGYNGSWESYTNSARLEGTLCEPKELRCITIQIEVLRDRSRGYFTLSQQSRLLSEKFGLLMLEHRTSKIHPLIARIEFFDQKNLQLGTSPNHRIMMTRNRRLQNGGSWGPRIFHGLIPGNGPVTLYI